ncbi:MAG: SDR family oxidoreductase, partial [Gaiellaceae bacterium]
EIGGRDRATYGQLMEEYARQRGLNRVFVSVPVLTPRLSSLWLGLVTPVYARVGRKLVESLQNETTVRDQSALETFDCEPIGLREALARALANEDREFALTRWSDAVSSGGIEPRWGGSRLGTRVVDTRSATVQTDQATAFEPISRIGGQTGWYYGDWLWQLRGFLDMLTGGVGLRRGRRDPSTLAVGETLDFWRVELFDPPQRLRLRAEMRVPGRAWLDFEVAEAPAGAVIRQTAIFDPAGVTGRMYWYGLYPVHELVFGGMLSGIARAAESAACPEATLPIRTARQAPPARS